jgi:hypothetical protein
VPLSEVARNSGVRIWREDFSSFTNVFLSGDNRMAWLNGITVPHWQAYVNGDPIEEIQRNNGAGTTKGLYAYWATNKLASTYSLGVLPTKDSGGFVYGLAFKNDTPFSVRKVTVGYDGAQFGFKNEGVHELLCECLVTNELVAVAEDGDWHSCAELKFCTTKDVNSGLKSGSDLPVVTSVSAEVSGVRIPRDSYFMIRWHRNATTHAAAMAIDNVVVSFEAEPHPMTIVIR